MIPMLHNTLTPFNNTKRTDQLDNVAQTRSDADNYILNGMKYEEPEPLLHQKLIDNYTFASFVTGINPGSSDTHKVHKIHKPQKRVNMCPKRIKIYSRSAKRAQMCPHLHNKVKKHKKSYKKNKSEPHKSCPHKVKRRKNKSEPKSKIVYDLRGSLCDLHGSACDLNGLTCVISTGIE